MGNTSQAEIQSGALAALKYPSYRSNRVVQALRIDLVVEVGDNYNLYFHGNYPAIAVARNLLARRPQPGDYYSKNQKDEAMIWPKDFFEASFSPLP